MVKNSIFLILVLMIVGCSALKKTNLSKTVDTELEKFSQLMQGDFSSESQSKSDTSYFNISLVMTPIWSDRTDGKWLYVEQAVSSKLDNPYRQRVYHLQHPSTNIFTSDIYTIQDAISFAGLQNDKQKKSKTNF